MKIIIGGAGGVGQYLAERLVQEGHDVVMVDNNADILSKVSSNIDIQTIAGSTSEIGTLKRAGLETADMFIAATNSDEANLIACLLADSLNQEIRKIARIRKLVTDNAGLSPEMRGVFDELINPDVESAQILMRLLEVPGARDVVDFAGDKIRVVGLTITQDAPAVEMQLKDLRSDEATKQMLVVAISRGDEIIIPRGEDALKQNDIVYVVAESSSTDHILALAGREFSPLRTVMMSGGSGVSRELAKLLLARDIRVKIIVRDEDKCEQFADELDGAVILSGEGMDQDLLVDEGIKDVDVFIGATSDDEDNILAALLAKKLGASRTAVVVNNMGYGRLVNTIGVDLVINPRIIVGSSILKFVRKGAVTSVFSILDDSAEVLETIATEKSKIVGKSLKELHLPQGSIIGAIVRDDHVTIPTGDSIVEAGDRIVLFSERRVLPKVEKLLEVGLSIF